MSKVGPYLPTTLEAIAAKSLRDKKHRFDSLYTLLNERNLKWAFYQLRKNASAGVDGVTWKMYEENLRENLQNLVMRLKSKSYRARLVKRKYIPKINGKVRPLGIPSLEDKVVQLAVTRILESLFDGHFYEGSYGYRRNRSAKEAVCDLKFGLTFGTFGYVVEADIKSFFDNIDHDWMLRMLEHRIRDKAFIGLIRKWLKAGILDDGLVVHPATGTPQGGIVSPVLANIYLHYALDLWFEKCIKARCSGKCFLVRYADDYVAVFQLKNEAEWFYKEQTIRLKKFNLETAPDKTKLNRFSRFLLKGGESFEFLGFHYQWRLARNDKPVVMATTSKKKFSASITAFKTWIKENRHKKVNNLMKLLKPKLQGYWNYYGIAGNSKSLCSIYRQIYELLYKWLNRRSHRKSYTLLGLNAMLEAFNIPKPRILPLPPLHRHRLLWS